MKTPAARWNPFGASIAKQPASARPRSDTPIERLEARIAPATLAGLPGNSSFEESTDFASWTVSAGPSSPFVEYLGSDVSTTIVRDGLAPEGGAYAHLSFQGRVAPAGSGFGPSIQSEIFTATAGEEISVVWRATNGVDVAHPRGRLFTADGTPVATFFDADTGTTAFSTSEVTVATAGQYYLLFEIGSSDVFVGGLIGAALDIDAIHRTPSGVSVTPLGSGQLDVQVTSENLSSSAPNSFLITKDSSGEYLQVFVNGSLDFVERASLVDHISVLGLGGDDRLTLDSTNGLITLAGGIDFDGAGGTDSLLLVQAGGTVQSSEAFNTGLVAGAGSSQIVGSAGAQLVTFVNVEPVFSNVPVTAFSVNGTASDNAIIYSTGPGGGIFTGATGKVSIDAASSIEFNNKSVVGINALDGNDSVVISQGPIPVGLAAIAVGGGGSTSAVGDTLVHSIGGAINPAGAGSGTITVSAGVAVTFSGFEVVAAGGVNLNNLGSTLDATITGDRAFAGQQDEFVVSTNATTHFVSVALNGVLGLYAHRSAIHEVIAGGGSGVDQLSLVGTADAENFAYSPTALDAGAIGIEGTVAVAYSNIEKIVLHGQAGDDRFAMGGSVGAVQVIGGAGSDRIDFTLAPSRVVFDMDLVGVEQFINATSQSVTLGDAIENFTGSAFNDTVRVRAANTARDVQAGANTFELFPPGDELILDGQQAVVSTTLLNPTDGTYFTRGYSAITFAGFETRSIVNSPSGLGFGTPTTSDAYSSAQAYKLVRSLIGGVPKAVATADLNGDGFTDIVAVTSKGKANVLLNAGDGSFQEALTFSTRGAGARDLVIGNFDSNPGLDLAVSNRDSNTVAVLSGDGTGNFAKAVLIKTPSRPTALAVGHIDGDATDDIAIAHPELGRVSVLLGNGTLLDRGASFRVIGLFPVDVVIADFDGDGNSDLVTANRQSSNVSFLKGDGLGGFAKADLYAAGARPNAIATADFNVDGVVDLAITHSRTGLVNFLFGDPAAAGVGTQFTSQLRIALAPQYSGTSIVAADFNGDGLVDVAIGKSKGSSFTVLIATSTTNFSQPYDFAFGSTINLASLAVGDFNNDGLIDVIASGKAILNGRTAVRVALQNT